MLFSKTNLTDGTHTIKVVVKGTKNAASKGTALVHDYFDFPVASASFIDDYSSDVAYTGNWLNFNNDNAYYNRTCHVAIQTNSDFTLTFTGNQVAWYGLKNDDLGMATIYIDDVLVGDDIDCYGTDRRVFKLFSIDGLSNGSHTFRLVQKGTKNPASKGTALVHDYISVSVPNSPISAITGDLTFGDVEKNTSSAKTFTISNTNILPLSVSSIILPAGFSTDWTSGDIKADTTKEIKITFTPTEAKNYTGMIKIFSNYGIDSIAVNGTGFIVTNISENADNKFRTYPNPVQNTLNIEANDPCNIAITDLSGKMLASKIMVGTIAKIDLSSFPKGVFLLKATNKNGDIFVQKIVKN